MFPFEGLVKGILARKSAIAIDKLTIMKKNFTPLLLTALALMIPFLFDRCTYRAYYQSPFYGNSETYHAIPLRADSLKSATYVSGVFTEGGSNDNLKDNVFAFTGSIYRSHNFGNFQGFYGVSGSLGSYDVTNDSGYKPSGGRATLYTPNPGSKFFGGYSASGGINVVIPLDRRGSEWRVVGASFTWQKEFGDYWGFRKRLPDSMANSIFNNTVTGILGLSTEFAFKTRHGMIGYKLMLAEDILNGGSHYRGYDNVQYRMQFFQQTLSFRRQRVTGSVQFNLGDRLFNAQLGVGYRLGR